MAALPLVMAIGSAVSTLGQIGAAKGNEAIANQNAQLSRDMAAADMETIRKRSRMAAGSIRASTAASGLSLEGSPLDVLESSVAEGEKDAYRRKYQGDLQAFGYETDAAKAKAQGKAALASGLLDTASAYYTGDAASKKIK